MQSLYGCHNTQNINLIATVSLDFLSTIELSVVAPFFVTKIDQREVGICQNLSIDCTW